MYRGQDLTGIVERLEAFEDRCGVRFEAIAAFVTSEDDDDWGIAVRGEMHAASGTKLKQDLEIEVIAYDDHGRVVQTASDWVSQDNFFGFYAFDLSFYVPRNLNVSRLRLFSKLN